MCIRDSIRIVEIDGEDGLMVTFSDITMGGYVVEELLLLEPIRERLTDYPISKLHHYPSIEAVQFDDLVGVAFGLGEA